MTYPRHTILAATLALVVPSVASATRFSWFDENPARDSLGQVRAPLSQFDPNSRVTFGIDAFKSLAPSLLDDDHWGDSTSVSFYGEVGRRPGEFRIPYAALHPGADGGPQISLGSSDSHLSGFGIKLQHRVDSSNTLAVSAGYSEAAMPMPSLSSLDILDTRAAVSWTSRWAGAMRPGMTGSVFVGDESVRDEAYQRLGRRYYGFSVGGEFRLAEDHTPYLSYRLRRNFDGPDDPNYLATPYEDRSQIAAGWKWQVQSNWSLQAEARYGLHGANLDPYSPDRSRIYFGTRFDFR